MISGRNEDGVVRAASELQNAHGNKVVGKAADVRSYDEVKQLFAFADATFGGVDILVNNAGVGVFRPAADLGIEEWQRVVETNLNGAFYCSREALFRFRIRGGGYIVNISSLAGKNAFAGGSAYNASKFGLNGFSEAAMLDYRYENVRVSLVMPGSVDTEFGGASTGAAWKIWPEDVAEIVLMLLHMPERTLISRVEVRPLQPKR